MQTRRVEYCPLGMVVGKKVESMEEKLEEGVETGAVMENVDTIDEERDDDEKVGEDTDEVRRGVEDPRELGDVDRRDRDGRDPGLVNEPTGSNVTLDWFDGWSNRWKRRCNCRSGREERRYGWCRERSSEIW